MRAGKIESILKRLESEGFVLTRRTIPFEGGTLYVLYVKHMVNLAAVSDEIIKPLVLCFSRRKPGLTAIRAREVMENILYAGECRLESDEQAAADAVLRGMAVVLLSWDAEYIVVDLKSVAHRAIADPQVQYTLRGPRDCFVENMSTNLSLVRYRVKDPKLRIRHYRVGRRSQTDVAVLYIEDIARDTVVELMDQRLKAIDVDAVCDTGELEVFLQSSKWRFLPQMGVVERSDMACHMLMEGKVIILAEGSGIALSAPKVFAEFFHSCDDRYDNMYFGLFMRSIRYLSLFFALTASSYYVAISSFHIDALPSQYVLDLAEMRARVPFSPVLGALLLETVVELLREALLRVPKQIGSAVGIVSAIVIGQAAIAAGIFSPLLLIIVSASLLASFVIPDFTLINPFRILKMFALISTGFLGFYGLILFLCLLLVHLVSIESFGVPYLAPFAPFNWYDFLRSLMFNISFSPLRPKYLKDKDKTRTKV